MRLSSERNKEVIYGVATQHTTVPIVDSSPHFSSGIVERERALKSTHSRKATRGVRARASLTLLSLHEAKWVL